MTERCRNPTATKYHRYGGVGVTVCERWRDFRNFLADMGERPNGTTLDRIDGLKGYEPGNCRWATPEQQAWNTKQAKKITFNGETRCAAEWAKFFGWDIQIVRSRLSRGWTVEMALTTAPGTVRRGRLSTKTQGT